MLLGDILEKLAGTLGSSEDKRFFQWLNENRGRLPDACRELGVDPPDEGPDLVRRLRERVAHKL